MPAGIVRPIVEHRFGAEVMPPATGVAGVGADGIGESGSQGLFEAEESVPSVGPRRFDAEVAPGSGLPGAFDGELPWLAGRFGAEAGTAADRVAVRVRNGLVGATDGIPRSCDGCVGSGPAGAVAVSREALCSLADHAVMSARFAVRSADTSPSEGAPSFGADVRSAAEAGVRLARRRGGRLGS